VASLLLARLDEDRQSGDPLVSCGSSADQLDCAAEIVIASRGLVACAVSSDASVQNGRFRCH
jgi:hypothetical protein